MDFSTTAALISYYCGLEKKESVVVKNCLNVAWMKLVLESVPSCLKQHGKQAISINKPFC